MRYFHPTIIALLALVAVAADPSLGMSSGITTRVSIASDGSEGNGHSTGYPTVSIDARGRYVAFESAASNLVAGDTNSAGDIFVHDRRKGTTVRVSVAVDGTEGNNDSHGPALSANGRFVAFYSEASNLVPGDTNNYVDVFVHDLHRGVTERVSADSDRNQGDRESVEPAISASGRFVAFMSVAAHMSDPCVGKPARSSVSLPWWPLLCSRRGHRHMQRRDPATPPNLLKVRDQ